MKPIETPVVFLPGMLCDERVWIKCWRHMQTEQRQYVPLQWANTLEEMLAMTTDRIDHAPQPVHLVGFSMGGYVATLAALTSTNIASLTLIGYNPDGLTETELRQRNETLRNIKQHQYQLDNLQWLKRYFTDAEMAKQDILQDVIDMANDLGTATLAAQITATTPRKPLSAELKHLDYPIHLIGAAQDSIAPPAALQRIAESLENAQFSLVKNSSHMMLLSQAQHVAEMITNKLKEVHY